MNPLPAGLRRERPESVGEISLRMIDGNPFSVSLLWLKRDEFVPRSEPDRLELGPEFNEVLDDGGSGWVELPKRSLSITSWRLVNVRSLRGSTRENVGKERTWLYRTFSISKNPS